MSHVRGQTITVPKLIIQPIFLGPNTDLRFDLSAFVCISMVPLITVGMPTMACRKWTVHEDVTVLLLVLLSV